MAATNGATNGNAEDIIDDDDDKYKYYECKYCMLSTRALGFLFISVPLDVDYIGQFILAYISFSVIFNVSIYNVDVLFIRSQ